MNVSSNTLKSIGNSFSAYYKQNCNLPPIKIEFYNVPFTDLEPRKDITFARVSFYELTENVTDLVSSGIANFSEQDYGVDISVVRGYLKDDSSRGEFPLSDIKDVLVEWSKVIDFGATTDVSIFTFSYQGSQPFIRNDRFVNRTFRFTAKRDLHKNQITG